MGASDRVRFVDGLEIELPALRLRWRLEDDGIAVSLDTHGDLRLSPASKVRQLPYRARIHQHKAELLALAVWQRDLERQAQRKELTAADIAWDAGVEPESSELAEEPG